MTSPSENIQSMGGKARAESLTGQERSAIAKEAAQARWARLKKKELISWRYGDVLVEVPANMTPDLWEKLHAYINIIRPTHF